MSSEPGKRIVGTPKHPEYLRLRAEARAMKETNDCSVIALAVLAGVPYRWAHKALERNGRKHRRGVYPYTMRVSFAWLGLSLVDVTKHYHARTLRMLAREVSSRDLLLVNVRGHYVAVRGGEIVDWSAQTLKRIKYIYRVIDTTKGGHAVKATTSKEISVTLVLSEDEAQTLMEMVRNPAYKNPGEEPLVEAQFRSILFHTLQQAINEE